MKHLILHKYFSINLFIFINIICILNFAVMLFMIAVKADKVFHLSNTIITMGIFSFIIIPLLIMLIAIEFILRRYKVLKKNCNDIFSQTQIRLVYLIAIILLVLYFTYTVKDVICSLNGVIFNFI